MTDHGGYLIGAPQAFTSGQVPSIRLRDAAVPVGAGSAANWPNPDFGKIPGDWMAGDWDIDKEHPILAMSLGLDVFDVEEDQPGEALITVPDGGWLAFDFTVDEAFVPGAGVSAAVAGAAYPNASVFSYLLPDSVVDEPPIENPGLAREPTDLGIDEGDELRGLNVHMTLFGTELAGEGSNFLTRALPDAGDPEQPVFVYFTLRPQFLAVGGATLKAWTTPWKTQQFSARSVYRSRWLPGDEPGLGRWDGPEFVFEITDPDPAVEAITGLSVNRITDAETTVLYSPRGVGIDDQLKFFRVGNGPPRRAIVSVNGNRRPAGRQIGAGTGVGDLCSVDPWPQPKRGRPMADSPAALDDFAFGRWLRSPFAPTGGARRHQLRAQAYIQGAGGRRFVRTCMNYPELQAGWMGHAYLGWYLFLGYDGPPNGIPLDPPTAPNPEHWLQLRIDQFDYTGGLVHRDYQVPNLPDGQEAKFAVAAVWGLMVGGSFHLSHVCAVRLM